MKQAVITGATGGIGHALAEGFAAAGYFVIATDLPETADFTRENIVYLPMDLRQETDIKQFFEHARQKYGVIDVLVNCGAISRMQKSPWELTAAEFDNVIHTNLRGTFLCCQNFLRANEGADYGRIINIASSSTSHLPDGIRTKRAGRLTAHPKAAWFLLPTASVYLCRIRR